MGYIILYKRRALNMKVKQELKLSECFKAKLDIDVYDLYRIVIIAVIPFVIYALFALSYFVFGWGRLSGLIIIIPSAFYLFLGILWSCFDFYDLSVDLYTNRVHDNDECLSDKATKKLFAVHTAILNLGALALFAAGITIVVLSIIYYIRDFSYIWTSICACIAFGMINISFFFFDVARVWEKEKNSIYGKYGAGQSYRPKYCKDCHCLDCFPDEPDEVEEKTSSGSYSDVRDRTVGTLKSDLGSVDIVKTVVEDVGYAYRDTIKKYKCRNCGRMEYRIDSKKIY